MVETGKFRRCKDADAAFLFLINFHTARAFRIILCASAKARRD
jgi:hypothetical protein